MLMNSGLSLVLLIITENLYKISLLELTLFLNYLIKKNQPYIWTLERNEAFEEIRHCWLSDPILCYHDFDKEFIVRTDASTQGIDVVLLQVEDDKLEHPICCVNRTLSPPERNYSVTDLEGLAINYAIQKFRQYIISNK